MATNTSVTYSAETLIAGPIKTDQALLKADTYYKGMPLKYTAGSDYYEYDATAATVAAFYLGDGSSRVIGGSGAVDAIILGGEIMASGIVNDSGTALTVDQDFIAAVAANGFYVKRK